MPYVVRDKNGCIVSILAHPADAGSERARLSDAEVRAFFRQDEGRQAVQEVLVASDLSFVRVLEDLISVLLDKHVIMLTDLPEPAREKLLQRKDIREYINNLGDLIEEDRGDADALI